MLERFSVAKLTLTRMEFSYLKIDDVFFLVGKHAFYVVA